MKHRVKAVALAVMLSWLAACARPAEPFVERAVELGIDFVNFNGMYGEYHYTEIIGSGGALLDYDNDGDLDVYLVQGAMLDPEVPLAETTYPPRAPLLDRLYRNELVETGSLGFVDVTESAGIVSDGYGMGVAVADYDADGFVDLYVTNFGSNVMLRNNGDGTFRDVTLESATDDPRWSTSATFLDYDADGRQDLFVVNYVDYTLANHKPCFSATSAVEYCGPSSYEPVPQSLFRNRGDGTFEDVSVPAQIARQYAAGLGVVATDFNGDGREDVYVASDGRPNILWINRGDGTFGDEALLAGCAVNEDGEAEASMGVDAADFDGDGDEDLFMTHLVDETNTLYVNNGSGWFDDATVETGLGAVSRVYTGFGTAWLDYDNDGRLDLVVANGAVKTIESLRRTGHPYPLGQRNQLFRNRGDAGFEEITDRAGTAFEAVDVSRGIAAGDVDNDGDADLLIVNNSGPARLLINEVGQQNSWIGLKLVDREGRRDLPGTRVEVVQSDGGTTWRRARVAGSYCSSGDPRVLVGLGRAGAVRVVRTHWPDGSVEEWKDLPTGRYTTLRQGGDSLRAWILLALLTLAGCGSATAPSGLEPVPYPETAELEEQVRAQLGEARKALEGRLAAGAEDQELARLFGETGMLYHAYELHEAASACYRNAAHLDPEDFRWVYYLGQVSLRMGQPERARAELERALEIRPDELPALIRLARVELARNRPERAEALFRRALEIDANSAAALLGLGKLALTKRDFESAVRHLEAARTLAPQATKIHYPLALAYRGLGRLELASTLLDQLGDVPAPLDDPWMREIGALVGGMRVHQLQGTLHFQEGQYELALAEFRRAVEEAPDEPLVRTNLALTLIQLGDPEGAEREFEHALRLDPSDTFAHYNLGKLLIDTGRPEAAVEHFEAAIERDPGQLRAHLNLGNALARLDRPEAALPHYRRVVEGDPGNAGARAAEARALAALGRWAEAQRRLDEAHAAVPEDLSIRNDLARLLAAAPDGGVRDGRRALALAQVLATPQMTLEQVETLAMVAAENGMFEKAVELQRRAVESVRAGGREELLQGLLRNLDRYRAGQACRDPWPEP